MVLKKPSPPKFKSPPRPANIFRLKGLNTNTLSKDVVSIEINTPLAIEEGDEIERTNNISMSHNFSSNEGVQKFQGKYYPKFLHGKAYLRYTGKFKPLVLGDGSIIIPKAPSVESENP